MKYKEAMEVIGALKEEGYEKEVPVAVLKQKIAQSSNSTKGWVITNILKDLEALDLIKLVRPGFFELRGT